LTICGIAFNLFATDLQTEDRMNVDIKKIEHKNQSGESIGMLRISVHLAVADYENLCRQAMAAKQSVSSYTRNIVRQATQVAA
jgi:hypothetical protein